MHIYKFTYEVWNKTNDGAELQWSISEFFTCWPKLEDLQKALINLLEGKELITAITNLNKAIPELKEDEQYALLSVPIENDTGYSRFDIEEVEIIMNYRQVEVVDNKKGETTCSSIKIPVKIYGLNMQK